MCGLSEEGEEGHTVLHWYLPGGSRVCHNVLQRPYRYPVSIRVSPPDQGTIVQSRFPRTTPTRVGRTNRRHAASCCLIDQYVPVPCTPARGCATTRRSGTLVVLPRKGRAEFCARRAGGAGSCRVLPPCQG